VAGVRSNNGGSIVASAGWRLAWLPGSPRRPARPPAPAASPASRAGPAWDHPGQDRRVEAATVEGKTHSASATFSSRCVCLMNAAVAAGGLGGSGHVNDRVSRCRGRAPMRGGTSDQLLRCCARLGLHSGQHRGPDRIRTGVTGFADERLTTRPRDRGTLDWIRTSGLRFRKPSLSADGDKLLARWRVVDGSATRTPFGTWRSSNVLGHTERRGF
jgi:hypothetical protein